MEAGIATSFQKPKNLTKLYYNVFRWIIAASLRSAVKPIVVRPCSCLIWEKLSFVRTDFWLNWSTLEQEKFFFYFLVRGKNQRKITACDLGRLNSIHSLLSNQIQVWEYFLEKITLKQKISFWSWTFRSLTSWRQPQPSAVPSTHRLQIKLRRTANAEIREKLNMTL